ncbi:MAG: hypothetical protein HYV63_09555 [Candidatus Schekmanbacteria bacterium]|nr:hypothetical protein [Candidatus Schekmanbacteria bacterium]
MPLKIGNVVITPIIVVSILAAASVLVGGLTLGPRLAETNFAGHISVLQKPVSGELLVFSEPGMFLQSFGRVTLYKISETVGFGAEKTQTEVDMGSIDTRFNDGASAVLKGSLRITLPTDVESILRLHKQFRSFEGLVNQVVKPAVANAIYTTGPHMSSAESYQARRNEFQGIALDQLLHGVYQTITVEREATDPLTGEKTFRTMAEVRRDDAGNPVRQTPSMIKQLNIQVDQFVITAIEYEERVYAQIRTQQEARMAAVTARAAAEQAEQEAITAKAQGEAKIAIARAEQEVEKTKLVTQAEAARDRAKLEAERADLEAQARLALAKAEAEANRLKVQAGLTPQERAEWDYKTAVGVAGELAKAPVPEIVFGSHGEGGGYGNPALDALTVQLLREAIAAGRPRGGTPPTAGQ